MHRADAVQLECLIHGPDEAESPTACHAHDAIAGSEVVDRVRGEHDRRRPVGEFAQAADQLGAGDRVEARRRLIQEEDVRVRQQLDRDARALALTSAQRAHPDLGLIGQAHGVERVTDRVIDLRRGCRRREPQTRCVAERALQGQVGVDDVVLRHVAEHAAEGAQVSVHVDAVEAHRPRGCRGDARDRLQQRRLAGAAGTDDRDELPSRDRERHGVQERQLVPVAEPDLPGQLVDVDADAASVDCDVNMLHLFGHWCSSCVGGASHGGRDR